MDTDDLRVFSIALSVNQLRNHALTHAGFPDQQNGAPRRRYGTNLFIELAEGLKEFAAGEEKEEKGKGK